MACIICNGSVRPFQNDDNAKLSIIIHPRDMADKVEYEKVGKLRREEIYQKCSTFS